MPFFVRAILSTTVLAVYACAAAAGAPAYADEIKSAVEAADKEYDIQGEIIVGLLDVESDFSPWAIGVRASKASLLASHLKHSGFLIWRKDGSDALSVFPRNIEEAKKLYSFFRNNTPGKKRFGVFNVDFGIAQINIANFERLGLGEEYYFDMKKNIHVGAKILRGCYDRFGEYGDHYVVECYNKGTDISKLRKSGFRYYQSLVKAMKSPRLALNKLHRSDAR